MKKLLPPAAAAIAVAIVAIILAAAPASTTSAAPSLDSEELAFITLLNNYRVQNGREPLYIDPDIDEAANWHSNDMGVNTYFSHTDSLGRSPWDRMCYFGYCYSTWKGENIAAGFSTGESVFNAWKNSPGHDSNMLQTAYKTMGLARVYVPNSMYGWYWTNDFAGYIAPGSLPPPGSSATPPPTASPTPAPTASPTPAPTAPPTPAPTPSPTPGCTNDIDCDGWSDGMENFLGTDRSDACSTTTGRNDEHPDAWPPDFNDDRSVNTLDAGSLVFVLNTRLGDTGYQQRYDLNADGIINTADAGRMVLSLHRSC